MTTPAGAPTPAVEPDTAAADAMTSGDQRARRIDAVLQVATIVIVAGLLVASFRSAGVSFENSAEGSGPAPALANTALPEPVMRLLPNCCCSAAAT